MDEHVEMLRLHPYAVPLLLPLQIFSNLVRKNIEGFVQYVEGKPDMVKNMIGAYGNTDIALHGGAMLRECVRYEKLARMTLYDDTLWLFFDQVRKNPRKVDLPSMQTKIQFVLSAQLYALRYVISSTKR